MPQELKLGKYKHYKGKLYQVLGVARHTETKELLVVYQALYDTEEFGPNALWVRPLSMFLEKVKVNDREVQRFEYWLDPCASASASRSCPKPLSELIQKY